MVDQVVIKADFSGVVLFFLSLFLFFSVSICISRLWTNESRKSLNFNEFVNKIFKEEEEEEKEEWINEDICTEIRKTAWYLVPKGSLGVLMTRVCILVLWNCYVMDEAFANLPLQQNSPTRKFFQTKRLEIITCLQS